MSKGDGMAEVTEADREKATQVVESKLGYTRDMFDDDPYEGREMDWVDAIAAALAEEREKARAPFLALAEEWRYKGEYGWGPWQAGEGPDIEGQILDDVALRIRRAAEEGS